MYMEPTKRTQTAFWSRSKFEVWRNYLKYQEALVSIVNTLDPNRYRILDVNPMTALRPDGHFSPGDCLHYCHPVSESA
jgi:hypothetical protein